MEKMILHIDGQIRTMVVDAHGSKGSGCIKEPSHVSICKKGPKRTIALTSMMLLGAHIYILQHGEVLVNVSPNEKERISKKM
jgi:hypothetical protein